MEGTWLDQVSTTEGMRLVAGDHVTSPSVLTLGIEPRFLYCQSNTPSTQPSGIPQRSSKLQSHRPGTD
ncbi:hypothetical protein RRG08_007063 [Elysia crispata]|uniref:Uncharacterized protein n=1 Tax=Elysia crispata TaxID=231223 RepID=A0AAE0XUG3_9GAST|nr:hypothetical protein RRG08_007063 [Elysia crispata]